jgi:alpha,alpha-trehalase
MADRRVAALAVELTPENWSGGLTVQTALDGSVTNSGVRRYRALASRHLEILERHHLGADVIFLRARTNQSLIQVAQAARTRLYRDGQDIEAERRLDEQPDAIAQEIATTVHEGQSIVVEKIVAFHTSLDRASSEPGLEAKRTLAYAGRFEDVLGAHVLAWSHLWDDCDISLEDHGAEDTELKLRVYIFHLLQTVSPQTIERDAGVPARGWHGEAYRGHIFWDELFIFPFLNLRLPTLTRALLRYRYRRLTEARRAALDAGYRGATAST